MVYLVFNEGWGGGRVDLAAEAIQLCRALTDLMPDEGEVLALRGERGYVRRRAEPGHGRVLRTELTKAGNRALALCDRAVDAVEREMLAQ